MPTISRAEAVAYRITGTPSQKLIAAAEAALSVLAKRPTPTFSPLNRAEEALRDALRNRTHTTEAKAAHDVLVA